MEGSILERKGTPERLGCAAASAKRWMLGRSAKDDGCKSLPVLGETLSRRSRRSNSGCEDSSLGSS